MGSRKMVQCNADTVCKLKIIQAYLQQVLKVTLSLADVLDRVLRQDQITMKIIKDQNIEF